MVSHNFNVLPTVLHKIFFVVSVCAIVSSSIMLFQGVCMRNPWEIKYVSEQLALCLQSDSPTFRSLPWIFGYGVVYQSLYLLHLWNHVHTHDDSVPFSGLLFHASVCHFVVNVASVIEFETDSLRTSKNDFLFFGQIQERTLHNLAAVQTFVNISVLHCTLYCQFCKHMQKYDRELQVYKRLDVLYILAVFIFCVLWICNLAFSASVEWLVLVFAFLLQWYAIIRWQKWIALQNALTSAQGDVSSNCCSCFGSRTWHKHATAISITFLLAYIVFNTVTLYIIAPPAMNDQSVNVLVTTPPFHVLVVGAILFISSDWGVRLISQKESII